MQFGAAGSIQYAGMDKTTLQNTFTDIDFIGGIFLLQMQDPLNKTKCGHEGGSSSIPARCQSANVKSTF